MARLWLVVVGIGLGACIQPDLTACDNGTLCPRGDVCDTAHGGCVAPEQLAVCAGSADESACTTSAISGVCLGGVCLTPGCGNHVVEPGEACDDGNRTSGDGCSADCTSTEVCGNGVLDSIKGEACDDGNLRNHDGCDSQCRVEELGFELVPYGPNIVAPAHGVMDEAHGVFLHYDSFGSTWGWDGIRWSLLATGGMPFLDPHLVYDTDRQHPMLVGEFDGSYVGDWDGTTWNLSPLTNGISYPAVAFYDSPAHAVAIVGSSGVIELPIGSTTWTQLQPIPSGETVVDLAFDRAHGAAVVVMTDAVYTWSDAQGWTPVPSSAAPSSISSAMNLVYDVDLGQVVAWGGCDASSCTGTGYAWDGVTWNALAATGAPATSGDELGYDPIAHRTVIVAGQSSFAPSVVSGSIATLDVGSSNWQSIGPTTPRIDLTGVATSVGGRDIYTTASTTWVRDATWSEVAVAPSSLGLRELTYDAGRDQIVGLDTNQTDLWLYDTAWHPSGVAVPELLTSAIYDPVVHGIVAVGSSKTWLLAMGATEWAPLTGDPEGLLGAQMVTYAFDASCDCIVRVVVAGGTFGSTQAAELDPGGWQDAAAPGGAFAYVTATWSARESAILLPEPAFIGGLPGAPGPLWERRNGSLTRGPLLPVHPNGAVFDEPRLGVVIAIGTIDGFNGELLIGYHGPGGEEVCDGTDGDGDGLVGCDDPDCWWTCTPACPPGTTC